MTEEDRQRKLASIKAGEVPPQGEAAQAEADAPTPGDRTDATTEDATQRHQFTEDEARAILEADGIKLQPKVAWRLPSKPLPFTHELCEPPGVVGELARYIYDTARCPRWCVSLAASIAFWGALFGRWYVTEEHTGNRTNFFVMVVLESSNGKDHPQKVLLRIGKRADALEIFESKVTSDTAIEQAMNEAWHVKLFLMDECGAFLKGASATNRNGTAGQDTILECFKELFSKAGSIYVSKRKVNVGTLRIEEPQANFYGSTTPDSFAAGMSPAEIEGGWTARCLVFMEDGLIRGEDKEGAIPYPEGLLDAVRRFAPVKGAEPPEAKTVFFTPEARAVYRRFEDEIFDLREQLTARRDPFRPIWGKVVENAKKLGLLYACSRAVTAGGDPSIDAAAAKWACRLAYTCGANLYLFASEHGGEDEYAELKSWAYREIKAAGTQGISPRDLSKKRRGMRSTDRNEVLQDLLETGDIVDLMAEEPKEGKVGRPAGGLLVAGCWLSKSAKQGKQFCPEVMWQK